MGPGAAGVGQGLVPGWFPLALPGCPSPSCSWSWWVRRCLQGWCWFLVHRSLLLVGVSSWALVGEKGGSVLNPACFPRLGLFPSCPEVPWHSYQRPKACMSPYVAAWFWWPSACLVTCLGPAGWQGVLARCNGELRWR